MAMVAALGLLAGCGETASDTVASSDPPTSVRSSTTVAPLVPGEVPAGLELAAAVDLPLPGADDRPVTALRLYGRGPDDEPFAATDLGVYTTPAGAAAAPADTEGRALRVRDHDGRAIDPYGPASWQLRAVRWRENGRLLQLLSHTLSIADMVKMAAALRFVADRTTLGDEPPDGLRLRAEQEEASLPGISSVAIASSAQGHVVSYTSPDRDPGIERFFVVGTQLGGPSDLLVLRWFYGAAMEPTTIAGGPGFIARMAGGTSEALAVPGCAVNGIGKTPSQPCEPPAPVVTTSQAVVLGWMRPDGALAVASAQGVDEAAVLRTANSVDAVEAAEWSSLRGAAVARKAQRDSG